MTGFDGTGRPGDEYSDPANWPGGNPGVASGGFPVSAQPPLAGYPSPGSATPSGSADDPHRSGSPDQPGVPHPAAPFEAAGPYGPGPQGGYPPPGYGAASYPGQPYPGYGSYPGYGQPNPPGYGAASHPGQPYPGYAYGAPRPSRPGTLVGAAVLAFITGGLDVMGGIFTLFLDAMSPLMSDLWWAPWLWVVTLVSLICGGLLIGGGVVAMRGPTTLLFVGAGGTAAIAIYWLAVIGEPSGGYTPFAALRVYPAIYLALCAVMVGLALAPTARGWRPDRPAVG